MNLKGRDHGRLIRDERTEILAFLKSLSPAQWESPSLCAGWRVRDVAVHLLVEEASAELGILRVLLLLARHRFNVNQTVHHVNAWWVRHNATRSTDSIVASFERSLEPGPLARMLWQSPLRAAVIHHQDMRRPLGAARTIPAERLVAVLDAVLTPLGGGNIGSRARAKGLRLRATDVDWTRGAGPEVYGPGEALLMALAGRGAALADLKGAGKEMLATRITPAAQAAAPAGTP